MTSVLNRRFKPSFGISEKIPISLKLLTVSSCFSGGSLPNCQRSVLLPGEGQTLRGKHQMLGETRGMSTAVSTSYQDNFWARSQAHQSLARVQKNSDRLSHRQGGSDLNFERFLNYPTLLERRCRLGNSYWQTAGSIARNCGGLRAR